jgi:hypothetical protein
MMLPGTIVAYENDQEDPNLESRAFTGRRALAGNARCSHRRPAGDGGGATSEPAIEWRPSLAVDPHALAAPEVLLACWDCASSYTICPEALRKNRTRQFAGVLRQDRIG